MTERMDDNQARKFLAAFADGELDVEQNLRVLEHMAMNPQATRRVMHQQQLRQVVDRSLREQAPTTPDALRRTVESMRVGPTAGRAVLARIGRWFPAAIAAALLIAAIVVVEQQPTVTPPAPGNVAPVVLAAEQATRFARRHVRCSRMIASLRDAEQYPRELAALPATLKQTLGSDELPGLDLSSLGYRYKMTGNCGIPGKPSVHLIYESTEGRLDALSLWITPYRGQPAIDPDKLYEAADVSQVHPILFWHHHGLLFYLVGDDSERTSQAAALLRQHSS